MKKLSRQAAIRLGRKRYFTGKECHKGHTSPRLVSNFACVACHDLKNRRWWTAHPEKRNAKARKYYEAHKASVRAWFRRWRRTNYTRVMLVTARKRALRDGVPFSICEADVDIPLRCPVLGRKLQKEGARGGPWSPTLDKFIPKRGYVKGNISVISHRANRLKSDGSLKEHEALVKWMRSRA